MIVKPVCVPCARFYRPERNGTAFTEMMPKENGAPPGVTAPDMWKPYKVWIGDLWMCHGCGNTIIVGVMGGPVTEHYQLEFDNIRTARGADAINVNDC